MAYAARSSTDFGNGFAYLNAANFEIQSKTITTAIALDSIAVLSSMADRLSQISPSGAHRYNYLVDECTKSLGDIIRRY